MGATRPCEQQRAVPQIHGLRQMDGEIEASQRRQPGCALGHLVIARVIQSPAHSTASLGRKADITRRQVQKERKETIHGKRR